MTNMNIKTKEKKNKCGLWKFIAQTSKPSIVRQKYSSALSIVWFKC